jgi:hypothetical protein
VSAPRRRNLSSRRPEMARRELRNVKPQVRATI